jgi:hypothetical protein
VEVALEANAAAIQQGTYNQPNFLQRIENRCEHTGTTYWREEKEEKKTNERTDKS